jgi:hypothetical protein
MSPEDTVLSEISHTQKTNAPRSDLHVELRSRENGGYQNLGIGQEMLGKGYKLSVRKRNPKDIMYNMVTVGSNNVFYS